MKRLPSSRHELLALLCGIAEPEVMNSVLEMLLSQSELQDVEHRLQIFQLLKKKMPHREIAAKLGVGIATVTRGAAAVKEPKFAPLAELVQKLERAHTDPKKTERRP